MITAKVKPVCHDIVLSYAAPDAALASVITREFTETGLLVFGLPGLALAGDPDAALGSAESFREALLESAALVVLLTPFHANSSALGVEVGAAWMSQKPIFILVNGISSPDVPPYL